MDVRCERCKTEYEFEDARITEAGVTVKCTTCEHVFKVKKKALVVTVPVRPGEVEYASAAPPAPPPGVAPAREWRVRQGSGNLFTFKELTTLQKWIVERKVSRDDEISLNGESWKRLGDIAELSSFFQVVDDALKAQQLIALQQQGLFTQAAQPAPAAAPSPAPAVPVQAPPAPQAAPPVAAAPPTLQPAAAQVTQTPAFTGTGTSISPPPDRTAVRSAARPVQEKSGGAARWLVAVLLLAGLGAGGWYGYQHHWLPLQAQKQVTAPVTVTPPAPPLPQGEGGGEGAVAEPAPAPTQPAVAEAAVAEAAVAEAAPEPVTEPVTEPTAPAEPAAPSEPVKPASATAPAPSEPAAVKPKERVLGFDQLVAQGDRLRLRDRPDLAMDAYEKAIELKPGRAEPIAGKGLALMDLGERVPAESAFREALRHNPRYAVAVMGLAETLRQQGKKAEAVEQYQRYLDILPNGPEASVARANIERLKE